MIARLRLPRIHGPQLRPARAFCEVDQWTFDPRYTQGRCPICGWAPEGVATAPRWLAVANRLDWEMLGLLLLADVLVMLGLIVASATGLMPAHGASFGAPSAPGGVASGVRTH